jgi:redox-regulated HSP33 family molecular chaperone
MSLHEERNACSSNEIFLESLEELKEVFYRCSCPPWLIKDKIKTFLQNDKKSDRPDSGRQKPQCQFVSIIPLEI